MTDETTATRLPAWLESAWLARYLDRQLSAGETVWFETYVLDKPDLLKMIETDNDLRDALAVEASEWRTVSEALDGNLAPDQARPMAGRDRQRASLKPAWTALAATLALGLLLGGIGQRSLVPGNRIPALIESPTRIVFDTLRGSATPVHVERANGNSAYVLVEAAVPPDAQQVTMRWDGSATGMLAPSADGFVSVLVDRETYRSLRSITLGYHTDGHAIERALPVSSQSTEGERQ